MMVRISLLACCNLLLTTLLQGQELRLNRTLKSESESVCFLAIAFSPDSKILAASNVTSLSLWDLSAGKRVRDLNAGSKAIMNVVFSSDGRQIATGSVDARLWDVATAKNIATFEDGINAVSFSPNARWLAYGDRAGGINLFDCVAGKKIATLKGHTNCINSISFSSDGKTIASGSDDSTCRLWDTSTQKCIAKFNANSKSVFHAIYSPTSEIVAVGDAEGRVTLWHVDLDTKNASIRGQDPLGLAFSSDGKLLATSSHAKRKDAATKPWEPDAEYFIHLWDVPSGKRLFTGKVDGPIASLAFSPNGKTLASGGFGKTMEIYDVKATGAPER